MDKKEWLNIYRDLQNEINRSERKQRLWLKGHEDILRDERANRLSREQFQSKTAKKQRNMKLELSGIQKYIQDVCSATADPRNLQTMLEKFEARLADYKLSMRDEYSALAREEESLSSELEAVQRDIGIWEDEPVLEMEKQAGNAIADAVSSDRVKARQNKLYEYHAKMGALDRKLASMGGRSGGWDPRDHDSFLKVLTVLQAHGSHLATNVIIPTSISTGGENEPELEIVGTSRLNGEAGDISGHSSYKRVTINPQFVSKFVTFLPGKTIDEIEEHVLWHMEYISIQSEKKLLLSEWREERSRNGYNVNKHDDSDHVSLDDESNKASRANQFDEAHLAAKRELVEQWRKQKQSEKEEEQRKLEEQRAAHKAKLDLENFQRRQEARLKLEQWKVEAENEDKKDEASVPQRPRSVDPATLRRRQSRDLELAKNRLEKSSNKAQQLNARETRLRQTENKRLQWEGPSKLLDSTKAAEAQRVTPEELDNLEHRRKHGSAHSARIASGGYDLKFSGRAKPTWTRGAQF